MLSYILIHNHNSTLTDRCMTPMPDWGPDRWRGLPSYRQGVTGTAEHPAQVVRPRLVLPCNNAEFQLPLPRGFLPQPVWKWVCKTLHRKRAKGSPSTFAPNLARMDNQDIITYSHIADGVFCPLPPYFFKLLYYHQSCFSGALVHVQEEIQILDH